MRRKRLSVLSFMRWSVLELHVVGDQRFDLLGLVAREAQAVQDAVRERTPSSTWPSKRIRSATRKVGGLPTSCRRAPRASVGVGLVQLFEQQQGVGPDVALGMIFGRLLDAFHGRDFRQHVGQQAARIQHFEAAPRAAFGEDADQFVANPLGGNPQDQRVVAADGLEGGGLDLEVEAGGEADGAQHAQMVFAKALVRVADGADDARVPGRRGRRRSPGYSPLSGSIIRPLMVKSRRSTSWRGSVSKCTCAGRRPSRYSWSLRKVATSTCAKTSRTSTTPKWAPTRPERGNRSMMRSGRASVATSKSFGLAPEQQIPYAAAHQVGLMAGACAVWRSPGGPGFGFHAPC